MNHEAWAIPYADLMTLLLAFFVVMYAVSVVNEGKFRVMSASLIQAFNGPDGPRAPRAVAPAAAGLPASLPAATSGAGALGIPLPLPVRPKPATAPASKPGGTQRDLASIENQVRRALQPLIDRKLVVVRHKPEGLEIEIRTDILFPSGVAQLSTSADVVLQKLAAILAPFPNPLRVEGFTDNVPISTPQYPSNWELSAARAASVARLFALTGVAPDRLGIVGWGEVRPLAENSTADGRNQNRRVVVVVMNDPTGAPSQLRDAASLGQVAQAQAASSAAEDALALPVVHVSPPSVPDHAGAPARPPGEPAVVPGSGAAVSAADAGPAQDRQRVGASR